MAIYLLEGITLSYLTVKVICDHKSGKSKGYGFVKFTSETEASTSLKEMDGQVISAISDLSLCNFYMLQSLCYAISLE